MVSKQDCVYILECSDGTLYTGWTNNIEKRFEAHQSGQGAKYTKVRRPVKLVYVELCEDRSTGMKREYEIKKMRRDEKIKLINNKMILKE
ncbi:MAG: GIY-YIG nuclease family protein [Culicoidibacterales bacterium]